MSFENNQIVNQIISALEKKYVESKNNQDVFGDVSTVQDDDEYRTHIPLVYSEQNNEEEPEEKEEEIPEEIPEEETETMPGGEAAVGMEMPGGEELAGMEMPGEEDEGPKTPEEVGQIYELKKVYSRLVAIESYLNTISDETLIKLRNFVSQAIDLFKTLISNIDLFKDKIDQILIMFYKFIDNVYDILRRYYKTTKENRGK
jgi:hypothetical protein